MTDVNTEILNSSNGNVEKAEQETSSGSNIPNSKNSNVAKSKNSDDNFGQNKMSDSCLDLPACILPHLMDRDINNPSADVANRRVQNPRLGVKVSYRNLTSQIVSREELAQEVMEHSIRKNIKTKVSEDGDVFFDMKVTHRLANKVNNGDTTSKNDNTTQMENSAIKEESNYGDVSNKITEPVSVFIDEDPMKNETPFDSKSDELYAEISSSLEKVNFINIQNVLKHSPASEKKMSASSFQPNQQELDNDTLLAILEGTTELNDNVALVTLPAVTTVLSPKPQTPVLKRKKREKLILDPNLEKQLALQQLMAFGKERNASRSKKNVDAFKPKEQNKKNSQSSSEIDKKVINGKRNSNSIADGPKTSTNKDQQPVKRKLRSSNSPPTKLNEKPVAPTDKYIKTYSNKRKLKSDYSSPEKSDKKSKLDQTAGSQISQEVKIKQPSADENRNEVILNDHQIVKRDVPSKHKASSKVMREINRLLGDEGAINMIYSVEQKRLSDDKRDTSYLASAKRKKKDLLLKTKMVKNAVLKLSMFSSQASPSRARRSSPEQTSGSITSTLSDKITSEVLDSNICDTTLKSVRKFGAEASKIIRKHSSSSAYSSDDTLSTSSKSANVNLKCANESAERLANLRSAIVIKECKFNDSKEKTPNASKKASNEITSKEKKILVEPTILSMGSNSEVFEQISFKEITVRKYEHLVQIILISSSSRMKNALNVEILKELISTLNNLQKNEKCRIVLITSTGSSFCQGIDLGSLMWADKAHRSKIVTDYVNTLTEFTNCLSQFPKLLIAGVHGAAVGLGVTMLPYFDMVIASDKATFYTPYVKLGQIPEAGATLTLPHLLGNAVTSELLFGCRMLTASEALQFGLVTRILWPDKFSEELLPLVKGIAGYSSQSIKATKQLIRQPMNAKLPEQLQIEAKFLKNHWCSEECQKRFKTYLEQEALLQNK